MKMSRNKAGLLYRFILIGMGLILLPLLAQAQPDRWWNDGWRYRMKVRTAAAMGAAQAQFPIPDGCAADGRDVRVIDASGRPCPMRMMYFQPGLYGIVAFQPNGSSHYWIYLGNSNAQAATASSSPGQTTLPPPSSSLPIPGRKGGKGAKKAARQAARAAGQAAAQQQAPNTPSDITQWHPQAGVFLETLRYEGGDPRNPSQFTQLVVGQAKYSFGAGYRDRIYEGLNPFGEPEKYVSLYQAYFNAPDDGEYLFATISKDASFLLVDGAPVAQWPGAHDAASGARSQHNGKIRLSRGIHRMDYLHADFGGDRQCVATAWMPPGSKAPRLMEPRDFVPIAGSEVESLEERGKPLTPDFRCAQTARLIKNDYTCLAYQFISCAAAPGSTVTDCRWQFSDGTVYAGGTINKVFFGSGDFTVTQTVRDGAGRSASATRPVRVHPITTQATPEEEQLLAYFAGVAAQMPAGMLAPPHALAAARLLADAQRYEDAARQYQDLVERQWKSEKKVDETAVHELAAVYTDRLRRPADAEKALRAQLTRVGENGPARARLLLALGQIELKALSQPATALATLRSARLLADKDPDQALRREVLIVLGDAALANAAADEALTAYQAAEALDNPADHKKYDRSSSALATEAYLREGQLDEAAAELEKWTSLYPTDRITGYATILEARLRNAQKDVAGAAALLEQFLKCKPLGVFAQMALEELAGYYRTLNRPAEARATYQKLLDEFQDESVQSRIRNKLDEMGAGNAAGNAAK